mgnify:CR=1 FL=1
MSLTRSSKRSTEADWDVAVTAPVLLIVASRDAEGNAAATEPQTGDEADEENDGSDDVITMARLDLHKHTFSSLFSRYSQCCKSPKRIQSFKNTYELSDFDIQWLENGATKR